MGLIIVGTPFFTGEDIAGTPYWNSVAVGVIVAGIALWNMLAARAGKFRQTLGSSTINLLAGLWLLVFPFVVATNMAYRWACVIEGIVLLVASGYVAWAAGRLRGAVTRRTA